MLFSSVLDVHQFARKETTESDEASIVAALALGIFITAGIILLVLDSVTIAMQVKQMIGNMRDGVITIREACSGQRG